MGEFIIVLFEIDVLMFLVGNPSISGWIFDHFNL